MKRYSFLIVFIVMFSSLFMTACGFKEDTELKIVSPAQNSRITTDASVEGNLAFTNMSAIVNTNRTDIATIPATIFVNETQQGVCTLQINTVTTCQFPMANTGVQNIRLEVSKMDGSTVSAKTQFLWIPNSGFDIVALKLAEVVSSKDPTMGYFIFGVLFIFIFAVIGLSTSKQNSIATTIVVVWVVLIGAVVVFMYVNPVYAYGMFNNIIGAITVISLLGLIGFMASRGYTFKSGGEVALLTRTFYPSGQLMNETGYRRKDATYFGEGKHLPRTQATEIMAIAENLQLMLPNLMDKARFLIEQFPDPNKRQTVIDIQPDAADIEECIGLLQGTNSVYGYETANQNKEKPYFGPYSS